MNAIVIQARSYYNLDHVEDYIWILFPEVGSHNKIKTDRTENWQLNWVVHKTELCQIVLLHATICGIYAGKT